jgi:vacuolar-type H+-ATPase subunit E/Vma4
MALEHLVTILRQGAEAECQAILAAARAEVEAIRARSETDLAERRGAALAARDADRRAAVEPALVVARRHGRRELLEARRRLLERVFAAARSRFPETLTSPEYQAALPGLITEALRCLGERDGTLRFHPSLRRTIHAAAGKRAGLRLVSDPGIGSGFKVQSADGRIEIDGTLEDRLDHLAPRVALEVAAEFEARR